MWSRMERTAIRRVRTSEGNRDKETTGDRHNRRMVQIVLRCDGMDLYRHLGEREKGKVERDHKRNIVSASAIETEYYLRS